MIKLRTYRFIGKFLGDITSLKPDDIIKYFGEARVYTKHIKLESGERITAFEQSLPQSEIMVRRSSQDYSELNSLKYWITSNEPDKPRELIGFPIFIEENSWSAEYGDSRVFGEVSGSDLILELKPELKNRGEND